MNEVFLGIIAVAVALMAAIQIGAVIVAARLARRVDRIAAQLESDIGPVVRNLGAMSENLTAMSAEAARATSLAAAQVERADRVFGDLAQRVDHTLNTLQSRVLSPARQGAALLAGLRAALAAFGDRRESRRTRRHSAVEEEDALFIG